MTATGTGPHGMVQLWREGWSATLNHPLLRPLAVVVMILVSFGEGFVSALLAPWMADIADGRGSDLGLMLSLQALGGIAGGALVIRWSSRGETLSLLSAGAIVSGVFLVAIPDKSTRNQCRSDRLPHRRDDRPADCMAPSPTAAVDVHAVTPLRRLRDYVRLPRRRVSDVPDDTGRGPGAPSSRPRSRSADLPLPP